MKIKLESMKINPSETGNDTKLVCMYNDEIVCTAQLTSSREGLQLKWIETEDQYKNKGIATEVMEHIANQALSKNLNLVIKAVDESTLNFYYKWFIRRLGNSHIDIEDIKDKFNNLVDDESLIITLSPDDLTWHLSEVRATSPKL
ncbi:MULTISPECIES: GNAT family N-acetyltransferase [unclassified Legionella]|uniref:GNAT family N-acetyltransferase n=1 Tax=unclassified Legionella TaxID=2622702 RepID=UPI001056102B|nr:MULTISPECIES: GNAT family N-acetyltransferase [unclassified Legionella]MDI9819012.1 GNAT family N-acetyltransferase [Legionella sp. PL877]